MRMTIYAPTEIVCPDISEGRVRVTLHAPALLFITEETDAFPMVRWDDLLEAFKDKELPRAEDH